MCVLPVGQNAPLGIGLYFSWSDKHTDNRNTAPAQSPDLLYTADSLFLRASPVKHEPKNTQTQM